MKEQEMRDYIDYVESKILTEETPFTFEQWQQANIECAEDEPKLCICCEEITEENAHLHRNCGK